jgi:hypothetical protein
MSHAALRAGASGFLLEDAQPTDLLSAVHLVARGESVLAPALVRRLIAPYVETPSPATPKPVWIDSLTPREIEVLLTKLNARDRTHLVIAAYEAGPIRDLELRDQLVQLVVAECHALECRQRMHRHRANHLDQFRILQ